VSARVLSVEGAVELRRAGAQKVGFTANEELKAGDTIVTGRGGRMVLGLSDGSQAVIAPKTTVVIQDLSASPRTLFQVIRGKARVRIEKLGGQPNPYRVNTPTAVIAVRGTIFDVLVGDDETDVFLHEGEVAVTSTAEPDRPVFLFAGQMTRVAPRQAPRSPGVFKPGRNDGEFRTERRTPESRQADERRAGADSRRGDPQPAQGERNGDRPEMRGDARRSSAMQFPSPSPNGASNTGGGGAGGGQRGRP
jgi:hypothetical protein